MKLLLDMGNTRIKWACSTDEGLMVGGREDHANTDFIDRLELAWKERELPEQVIATSVANEGIGRQIRALVSRLWGLDIEFLSSPAESLGVRNSYANPAALGIDRWAALVAVYCQSGGPACVIDCGTAITLDAVDAEGQHMGGLIMPGLHLMRGALNRQTHAIEVGDASPNAGRDFRLGTDTDSGVHFGILYAVRGFIEQNVAELSASLEGNLGCYITGGDAELLIAHLGPGYNHEPDLVLKGLALLAEVQG